MYITTKIPPLFIIKNDGNTYKLYHIIFKFKRRIKKLKYIISNTLPI